MITVYKCPVCSSDQLQFIRSYEVIRDSRLTREEIREGRQSYENEMLWIFFNEILPQESSAGFRLELCCACGLIFLNPRPSDEELHHVYKTVEDLDLPKKRRDRQPFLKLDKRARRIYSVVSCLSSSSAGKKVLDYGGMHGQNLVSFVKNDFQGYVLDFLKFELCPGVEYLGADVCDLAEGQIFDVILLNHVLEHALQPVRLIESIVKHLSQDGLIYVEVPLGCLQEWQLVYEPLTHQNFFSEESCYKCLRMCGLDILYIITCNQWVYWDKTPCVNIVACKREGNTVSHYKTTWEQMDRSRYFWMNFKKTPRKQIKKTVKSVLSRINQTCKLFWRI
ncbi:MAG: class I SAM-dependent methyltransferase [Sedimentisphaerales bacterium]|nr:class I SAM-dependent methyltransferase [Sedimentisphaerales bacterium]